MPFPFAGEGVSRRRNHHRRHCSSHSTPLLVVELSWVVVMVMTIGVVSALHPSESKALLHQHSNYKYRLGGGNDTKPSLNWTSLSKPHNPKSIARFKNFAKPDFSLYYSMDELLQEVNRLVDSHSDFATKDTIVREDEGYAANISVITVGQDYNADAKNPLRLLFNFGEHARELITSEVALDFLTDLLGRLSNTSYRGDEVRHSIIKIVPLENPNGRRLVENGDLCERKNGRGTDPNRNWEVDWGVKERDYDPYEEFPGKRPYSEPEASIMRSLVESFRPHVWVNVHSGMEALFLPYDHVAQIPEQDARTGPMQEMLSMINFKHCRARCAVGSGGKEVGYLAHGTATDAVFEKFNVPMTFTWEIYGGQANYNDCFRLFNPISSQGHGDVVSRWSAALFSVIENVRRLIPDTVGVYHKNSQQEEEEQQQQQQQQQGHQYLNQTEIWDSSNDQNDNDDQNYFFLQSNSIMAAIDSRVLADSHPDWWAAIKAASMRFVLPLGLTSLTFTILFLKFLLGRSGGGRNHRCNKKRRKVRGMLG